MALHSSEQSSSHRLSVGAKFFTASYIVIPWLATVYGIYLIWAWVTTGVQTVSWVNLGQCLVLVYLTMVLGVSLGHHRSSTHPTYTTHRWVKFTLFGLAVAAWQGFLKNWRKWHRNHHRHSDVACKTPGVTACDTHSPRDGNFHAFVGWFFKGLPPASEEDIKREQFLLERMRERNVDPAKIRRQEIVVENVEIASKVDRYVVHLAVLGLLLPCLIGGFGLGTWSWAEAWGGLLWGGLIRICWVNTTTSMINWYCHLPNAPGNYRHVETNDDSRNNILLAFTGNPEWAHATHHLIPDSANQGIYWWELIFDYSAHLLWVGERMGIFWNVNWTSVQEFEEIVKRVKAGKEQLQERVLVQATS